MSHINLVQWIPSHLSEMFFWQSNIQWSHEKMGETSDSYCSSWWLKFHPVWNICWLIKLDHEIPQGSGEDFLLKRIWSSTTKWYCWWKKSCTRWICRLSHYLQGFVHPRWLAGFLSPTVTFEPCRNSIQNIWMAGKGWSKGWSKMYLPTSQASWKSKGAHPPQGNCRPYFTLLSNCHCSENTGSQTKSSVSLSYCWWKKNPAPLEVGNRLVMYNLSHYLLRSQVVSWI